MTGTYIVVEGLDGSGKTTAIEGVAEALNDTVVTREPRDDRWGGKVVRDALQRETRPMTDTFAFMLDRAEHLEDTVRPALEEGRTVLSDRGHLSTYAYQYDDLEEGLEDEDPWNWLDEVYGPWNTKPDITIYMNVSALTAAARMEGGDKYEDIEFLKSVETNYDVLIGALDHDVIIVDAEQPREDVVDEAVRKTREVLDQ